MRRRTVATAVLMMAVLLASSASADVIAVPRPATTLTLSHVSLVRAEAPEADADAVTAAVRRQLGRQGRRLASCLANVDLREDPVRRRGRSLTGQMRFDRSGRPDVRLVRARGIPQAAQQCVMEVARSVSAPAPRGAVEVRFIYTVR